MKYKSLNTYSSIRRFLLKNSYLLVVAAWLVTISFIIDNYWSGDASVRVVTQKLTNHIQDAEKDFARFVKDTAAIELLARSAYSEDFLVHQSPKNYFLFIYHQEQPQTFRLDFWNTQVVQPDASILKCQDNMGFSQQSNGYYFWRKFRLNQYQAIALVPVKWNYSITNEYLQNNFVTGEALDKAYRISTDTTGYSIRSVNGQKLFSIESRLENHFLQNNTIAICLRLAAVLLLLLFIHLMAVYFVQQRFLKGALFLMIVVAGLRSLSYFIPVPFNFRQFELFDPAIYGSTVILRSLGDLLINALLFLWVVLFIRHFLQEKNIVLVCKYPVVRWLKIMVGIILLLIGTYTCGWVFQSMVADSQISFDVVNFFSLNLYSIIGFIVLGTIAIGYFFFTQIIIYLVQPILKKNIIWLMILVGITGLLLLTLGIYDADTQFKISLLAWLMVYLVLQNSKYLFLQVSSFISSRFIFWLFFFSMSISVIIIIENKRNELQKRKQYAETLAIKANPASERLMNTVLTDFRNESLAPLFDQFRNDSTNEVLKDSLLSNNFAGYLNQYDTRIFTFGRQEEPLFNADSTTFNTLNTIIKSQGKPTAVADLYYYDLSYDKFTYISKKTITDTSNMLLGYVFILATPKKYKMDALYPELFLRGYNNSIENSPVYSYAVYNNLRLINSHNDYEFPSQITTAQLPTVEYLQFRHNNYDELWYKAGKDKLVIIAKANNYFIESITLFSYLFCSFLFVAGIFWLLNVLIRSRFRLTAMKKSWQMSIRSQVHSTIIIISLMSFIVIGVATIMFFINRYHNNNREKLSTTIHVMENEIHNSLSELMVMDDVVKIYDDAYKDKLEKLISKISEVHAVDINLYDLEGDLKVSTLPLPYNKGIVSTRMDPIAFYHLDHLKDIQFFNEEKIGTLQYLSNYVPVIDESGKAYAYLNIPYFTSQTKLRQEISNFLVAIINLNAFIFLIAGIIAFFLTNRITQSFSFISNKMREVNLGKKNEKIIWNRNDEIGQLVNEYNTMVSKLDESALILATSEREGAWREMAQQVAHEIKNPLTPMKLSLQYLQRAIDNKTPNINELTKKVSETLVEQIDHLSQIAGQFSQFANISHPRNERIDLNESLKLVIQLFSSKEHVEINWQPALHEVFIHADRTHINRLFTNLIQNAIQSVPENSQPQIDIEMKSSGTSVTVSIRDNGTGIDPDLISKIFTPNFTTKTSGTGLGLAMCKSIVENAGGRIWFETMVSKGTVFYVELPQTGTTDVLESV